ncbi:MAG: MBOAT family O-acyltransferase [Planctomycetia bacterium]|jgi:alginate O-acetyltransferase complex protein AlgI
MLFNSVAFIFVFLPVVLALTYVAARSRHKHIAADVVLLASLLFYGWWDYTRLPLLVGMIVVNHLLARVMWKWPGGKTSCLFAAVVLNVGLLAYFKYRGFILGDVLGLPGISTESATASLPLGISFFTFQQLAWLFDSARPGADRTPLPTYALFVTFFPQLIAGPIVHHAELVPQLTRPTFGIVRPRTFAAGVSLFVIGLAKKVMGADFFAPFADAAFQAAGQGSLLQCGQAWVGLGAYACQIYFDFSGYSDMALGLGLLFGVVLPANFASPYKAQDIADFWRRWHITLSRFLRDFVYIPLGGNRLGSLRTSFNLIATMVIGGLWHGAGYPFILWGLLHGILLAIAHFHRRGLSTGLRWWPRLGPAAWGVTFIAILLTWVPFRADTITTAGRMYRSLFSPLVDFVCLVARPTETTVTVPLNLPMVGDMATVAVLLGLLACVSLPCTVDIFRKYLRTENSHYPLAADGRLTRWLRWRPSAFWAVITGVLLFFSIMDLLSASPSPFLYFQF